MIAYKLELVIKRDLSSVATQDLSYNGSSNLHGKLLCRKVNLLKLLPNCIRLLQPCNT